MRFIAIALGWIVSVLALLLIAGQGPWAGRPLFGFGGHGVHVGDLPVVILWSLAMWGCVEIWRRSGP